MELNNEDFPVTGKIVYLDTAANGLLPSSTIKVMEEYVQDLCNWERGIGDWKKRVEDWTAGRDIWKKKAEDSKGLFAQIIGAKEKEIAFIPNDTTGINIVFFYAANGTRSKHCLYKHILSDGSYRMPETEGKGS